MHIRHDERGQWRRFGILLVLTALILTPIVVPVIQSVAPGFGAAGPLRFSLREYTELFAPGSLAPVWLLNSTALSLTAVITAVVVGAPAGYVLSRARGRLVSTYSLLLFAAQAIPTFAILPPLFLYFAWFGLYDNLYGLALIYVAVALPIATWMLGAFFDRIPISLEEAAWIDGCSVFGGFVRIIMRNALPGILSTAIFTFLLVWNDYLVAFLFLRSDGNLTLPVGFDAVNGAPAVLLLLPPLLVFALLNRFFRIGGLATDLGDR